MAGYNPDFLGNGINLPVPAFAPSLVGDVLRSSLLQDDIFASYINYSIITHRVRRSAIIACFNIDQNLIKDVPRKRDWNIDTRIGADFQLDNDYYRNNPWDRGHLARRRSIGWGQTEREAKRASDETFYYSNASLQHENFNQDEWLALENWVFDLDLDSNGKITVFTGPVYGDFPRTITPPGRESALIPSAFFKVVCFVNKDSNELDVRAFLMFQDEQALADKEGNKIFNFQRYQVTITEIERLTGLEFDDEIYEKNPLLFNENPEKQEQLHIQQFPERIEVDAPYEMIAKGEPRDAVAIDNAAIFIAAAMVNPSGDERESEWVSVINLSSEPVNLEGWTLSDTKHEPLQLNSILKEQQRTLKPGEAVRIQPLNPVMLSNRGGVISLYDNQGKGRRIDRVSYTARDVEREDFTVRFLRRG
ncbi:DNA/RNA non-specific endonuclease [Plectonema cf. radiosum LEGE 06105]|uniref:DNA/RNA non-specific endonuclease n=1 Tax=Plectonema cf. radiosum LEGE 06105 TaxID=945769 RepID=A0A8J7F0S2_9CYAN|nr:DNA/RNA non-specific endonuclease [Plectonema radiosum]MBE9211458.1 DNA/RNA non-specific endonuclease [Plectonema cf. radiosum LEGE 06105]